MDKAKQIPSDDRLNRMMNDVYNLWFAKWKDRTDLTDDMWTRIFAEANQMIMENQQYPVIENLVITFLYEISARAHGGYTPAMQSKIRDLMEARYGK